MGPPLLVVTTSDRQRRPDLNSSIQHPETRLRHRTVRTGLGGKENTTGTKTEAVLRAWTKRIVPAQGLATKTCQPLKSDFGIELRDIAELVLAFGNQRLDGQLH
jgi:hypothetical protein